MITYVTLHSLNQSRITIKRLIHAYWKVDNCIIYKDMQMKEGGSML